jgi:hypothetical protein
MNRQWVLLWALVGCSTHERVAPHEESAGTATHTAVSRAAVDPKAARASGAPGNLAADRLVIREASLRLRSANPRKTADEAARIANAAGGFVLNSELRTVDDHVREVEVQLRVPQQSLDVTLRELRRLGTVLLERVLGEDVTEEFVDVSARLRAQRTLEGRLLALLQSSAALKDMLIVEQELARVRTDIEQQEGRIRYLEERSRMASIQVVALAPEQPLVASTQRVGSRFSNAFRRSLEVAVSVTEFLITAAGFMLPLVLCGIALAGPVLWMRRRRIAGQHAAVGM